MKIEITNDVVHKKNHTYGCIRVQFEPGDSHYWPNANNWLPLNKEVFALHQLFLAMDWEYRKLVNQYHGGLTLVGPKVKMVVEKDVTDDSRQQDKPAVAGTDGTPGA